MAWDFDEITELHARAPGQALSSVERLLEVGAASPDVLCELSDALEERGGGYVGALFQLPFEVALEGDWQSLPTSRDTLTADVRLQAMRLHLDDFGRFSLQAATETDRQLEPGSHLITQGMAVFQVWGKRARPHSRYLTLLDQGRKDAVLIDQRESWIQNRPMTVQDYEHNFARRLRQEVGVMLANLLPTYSLLSRSETPVPDRVYGFVPMLAPGRIGFIGSATPVAKALLTGRPSAGIAPVAQQELTIALRRAHRRIGRFETQLLAMERLRREGETALAVVGTAALLEWLLGSLFPAKRKQELKLHALIRAPELSFIPPHLLELADAARDARNKIVHGAPPTRQNPTRSAGTHGVGRELGLDPRMSSGEARKLIEGAFEIFRSVNLHYRRTDT